MKLSVGDFVKLKKNHPCGKNSYKFEVTRAGADVKLKCAACGRELMLPRQKAEKMIREQI